MKNLIQIDDNTSFIENDHDVDITLFANKNVPIETSGIEEARGLADLQNTCDKLSKLDFFGDVKGRVKQIAISPDFHKGLGIPIGTSISTQGFIIPKAVGGDIFCGMAFTTTDITIEEFGSLGKDLDNMLRYIFFEGGRNIALDEIQREAILRDGIDGLLNTKKSHDKGILSCYSLDNFKNYHMSKLDTCDCFTFDGYAKGSGGISYDSQIGSIGHGNHFVELQTIEEIIDYQTCKSWGLKKDTIAIMAHSGSVGLGSSVGMYFEDIAKKIWPNEELKPVNGFFIIPSTGKYASYVDRYFSAMGNASNFAVVNRLFLTLMTAETLKRVLKRDINLNLVYDAPHNLIWKQENHNFLHRKGSMPAELTEKFPDGHPVIVPGSMGDVSWILKGMGNINSLCSSAHGSGRVKRRGDARNINIDEIKRLRLISKIDPDKILRKDILDEYWKNLAEEAPSCYKESTPVINTLVDSGIASRVCKMVPLLTIKG